MDDMSGETFNEFETPSPEELSIPPVLHAVPASTAGPLLTHQLVTLKAGTGWLVDETFVVDTPSGFGEEERYPVASLGEYGAIELRPHEQIPL